MEEQIVEIINSKNKLFLKNKKYIIDNNWSEKVINTTKGGKKDKDDLKELKNSIEYKKKEFKIQNNLVKGMLQHLTRFLKKLKSVDVSEDTQKFLDESLEIIELHTNRVDFYVDNIDVSEIENIDIRSDELEFHNDISKEVDLVLDSINNLGLKNSKVADTTGIAFRDDIKAPLSMHWILSEIYPEINKKLKEKGVDLDEPSSNNEMLLYMDNVPVWDTNLHYWEQKTDTLKFYGHEFFKAKNGLNIDGVYISGWAYYHINIFGTFPYYLQEQLQNFYHCSLYYKHHRHPCKYYK